jgi:hypothetical protein
MIDTDMISSPNFARLVYDGDGPTFGQDVSGPAGSGLIEKQFVDYWNKRGMQNEPIPFDGRSDYVGFVNRGIPSGGVFAGAEAPKTAPAGAVVRRCTGRAAGPLLPRGLRQLRDGHRQAAGGDDELYENDPTPANLAIAQQQADVLDGGATRSLQQFKDNLVHAIWYFARAKGAVPDRTATAMAKQGKAHRVKALGHQHAGTR